MSRMKCSGVFWCSLTVGASCSTKSPMSSSPCLLPSSRKMVSLLARERHTKDSLRIQYNVPHCISCTKTSRQMRNMPHGLHVKLVYTYRSSISQDVQIRWRVLWTPRRPKIVPIEQLVLWANEVQTQEELHPTFSHHGQHRCENAKHKGFAADEADEHPLRDIIHRWNLLHKPSVAASVNDCEYTWPRWPP